LSEDGQLLDPQTALATIVGTDILFVSQLPQDVRFRLGDNRHVDAFEHTIKEACLAELRILAMHIGACQIGPRDFVVDSIMRRIRSGLAPREPATSAAPSTAAPSTPVSGTSALHADAEGDADDSHLMQRWLEVTPLGCWVKLGEL
jgi:hypothetical protein